jgi:hypothetical protein
MSLPGLDVRHFERLKDEPEHLLLRPTIDTHSRPGDCSSVSDEHDNVHWFVATRGPAYTLDVIVPALAPEKPWGRDYVDPASAERLPNGEQRARRIGFAEAIRLYGKT